MAEGRRKKSGCCTRHPVACGVCLLVTAAISLAVVVGAAVGIRPVLHNVFEDGVDKVYTCTCVHVQSLFLGCKYCLRNEVTVQPEVRTFRHLSFRICPLIRGAIIWGNQIMQIGEILVCYRIRHCFLAAPTVQKPPNTCILGTVVIMSGRG